MSIGIERVFAMGVLILATLATPSGAMAQTKPVPLINQPLVPDAVAPGGPAFILTVNGTGFVNNSVVEWNGSKRTTTVVSHSQLTATISARDIATAGTGSVTVVNPAPTGGRSNVAFLSITNSTSTVGFRLGSSPMTGRSPIAVAVGDFDNDGKLDLAVVNEVARNSTVSILLGDGMGNFTLASSPSTGGDSDSIAVGDFNGDGNLDLAVGNGEDGTESILLGDGTGNFTLASTPEGGGGAVAVGDFNSDGKLDLAVANFIDGTVSVLLGDGTGNFTLASSPATGIGPDSVAVADFNGDGHLDLAVVNLESQTVSILLGDGTGNFALTSSPATGGLPQSVAVGDFNGDGNLDLAVANENNPGTVSILLGDGTGNFTLASTPAVYQPGSVAVGDFNGDGKLDLAVADYQSATSTASVLLGDGTGHFTLASSPYTAPGGSGSVAVGDFNSDGKLDMAVADGGDTISVLLQAPAVMISPGSLNFGDLVIGTTSGSQSATVKNVGYATVNISRITLTDPTEFFESNNCPSSLAVGASCMITVTFSPTTSGAGTAAVAVSDDGGNNPTTLSLTGTGLSLELSATSLNFGDVMVGHSSQPQTVMLTNVTATKVNIRDISVTGNNPGDFSESNTCGAKLEGGKSCNIVVTFTPTQMGSRSATIKISDNGGGGPLKIKLSGTGT